MTQTANLDELLTQLGDIHKAHEQTALALGDQVLAVLERLGLAELVRWRLRLEQVAEVKALPPASIETAAPVERKRPKRKRTAKRKTTTSSTCTWNDCGRKLFCAGLCSAHYFRRKNGKDMDAPIRRSPGTGKKARSSTKAEPEKRSAAPIGHPAELAKHIPKSEAALHQKPRCAAFANCVEYAKAKGWKRGHSCMACAGPGKTKSRPGGNRR